MAAKARVLVYGGRGALGSHCVAHLRSRGCWVCSLDLGENESADSNIVATPATTLTEQAASVAEKAKEVLKEPLDAVFCVAGGWAGGNAASKNYIDNCDLVLRQSIWTSVIATQLASRHLKPGGLLVLTGAQASLGPTPGMSGYGMAKAAVHQLIQSLGAEGSGLPADAKAVAILPEVLDTPMNRKFMGEDNLAKWTPLSFVSELFDKWMTSEPPISGKLYKLTTENFVTNVTPV